jgi:hypothetical protein
MTRRVHKLAVALLALSLTLSAPSAYAAADHDGGWWNPRGAYERVVHAVKKLLKPIIGTSEDDQYRSGPPIP